MKGGDKMEERIKVFSTKKCLEHIKLIMPSWYDFCERATDSWVYRFDGRPIEEMTMLGYAVMENWVEEVEVKK